ncbi:DUF4190 domain-containing protein [Streptomyces sp. SAS_270]|uniref:DUF4190 domain-containing protein n=1 Tax=Streptomyces sp. SAS_270 TaxID=3412748 RepID=UPI00403D063A
MPDDAQEPEAAAANPWAPPAPPPAEDSAPAPAGEAATPGAGEAFGGSAGRGDERGPEVAGALGWASPSSSCEGSAPGPSAEDAVADAVPGAYVGPVDAVPGVSAGPVDRAPGVSVGPGGAGPAAGRPSDPAPGQGPAGESRVPLDKVVDVPRAEPNPWAPPVETPRPPRRGTHTFPSAPSPSSPSSPSVFSAPSVHGEPVPPPPVGPEGPGLPPYGHGYGWPAMPLAPSNGMGTAGLVLGILAALVFCVWPLAIVLGILGVVFGALGRRKARRGEATNPGQALAGIICGAVGIALGIAVVVIVLVARHDSGDGDSDDGGDGFSTSLSLSLPPAAQHVRQDL